MVRISEIVNYMACELCYSQIIKSNQFYCKRCQVKTRCNETSNRKLHSIRLSKNSGSLAEVLNVAKEYIESKYSSNNLNDNSSLSIIQYTHEADNIHNYEWSNFQKIEEFGSYIISCNQFPIIEFIYRWSDDIETIPRIKSFIYDHKNESSEICIKSKTRHISIIARPLLLMSQEAFWTDLMESYFKFVHPGCTLFSLVDFDPKSAPDSLLSAIYFAGFVAQSNPPEEIRSYMLSYAINNIKKILLSVKLSSAQALGLYSYALYLHGYSSLSRVCLSHFARMSHALGISINRKKFSALDRYNRNLINNKMRLYYIWVKLGPSSYDVASEDDEDNLDIYGPKFQFPNPSLNLCNDEFKGTLYSIFCCQFAKIKDFNVNNVSKFCKYDSKKMKIEIIRLTNKANEIYTDAKLTFESVINLAPEYKIQTSIYLKFIRAIYLLCILCIYSKILETSKKRDLGIIQSILDKGIELWELISSNAVFIDIWSWGPYVVGLHLIQVYPYCSKKQKKSALFILKSIIDLFYKEGYNINSINFLILKTQFDLINNN